MNVRHSICEIMSRTNRARPIGEATQRHIYRATGMSVGLKFIGEQGFKIAWMQPSSVLRLYHRTAPFPDLLTPEYIPWLLKTQRHEFSDFYEKDMVAWPCFWFAWTGKGNEYRTTFSNFVSVDIFGRETFEGYQFENMSLQSFLRFIEEHRKQPDLNGLPLCFQLNRPPIIQRNSFRDFSGK